MGEVKCVYSSGQSKMPDCWQRNAPAQRTQHEVGHDAFFRFANNLPNQLLVMLRSDAQLGARATFIPRSRP
jgi:hypothetical protein